MPARKTSSKTFAASPRPRAPFARAEVKKAMAGTPFETLLEPISQPALEPEIVVGLIKAERTMRSHHWYKRARHTPKSNLSWRLSLRLPWNRAAHRKIGGADLFPGPSDGARRPGDRLVDAVFSFLILAALLLVGLGMALWPYSDLERE
jgi:hypothetical protein